eukprot:TRINITY_DN3278_c0_g1_i1.p1 TRINITY_DN3278_c0_g1~~TRINITY_DN3278_c0_g1_i1.p1  ORF type:complete len:538 (+),score=84.49 TRINITY_DN3278_c0_g1_i1:52-1665(+)
MLIMEPLAARRRVPVQIPAWLDTALAPENQKRFVDSLANDSTLSPDNKVGGRRRSLSPGGKRDSIQMTPAFAMAAKAYETPSNERQYSFSASPSMLTFQESAAAGRRGSFEMEEGIELEHVIPSKRLGTTMPLPPMRPAAANARSPTPTIVSPDYHLRKSPVFTTSTSQSTASVSEGVSPSPSPPRQRPTIPPLLMPIPSQSRRSSTSSSDTVASSILPAPVTFQPTVVAPAYLKPALPQQMRTLAKKDIGSSDSLASFNVTPADSPRERSSDYPVDRIMSFHQLRIAAQPAPTAASTSAVKTSSTTAFGAPRARNVLSPTPINTSLGLDRIEVPSRRAISVSPSALRTSAPSDNSPTIAQKLGEALPTTGPSTAASTVSGGVRTSHSSGQVPWLSADEVARRRPSYMAPLRRGERSPSPEIMAIASTAKFASAPPAGYDGDTTHWKQKARAMIFSSPIAMTGSSANTAQQQQQQPQQQQQQRSPSPEAKLAAPRTQSKMPPIAHRRRASEDHSSVLAYTAEKQKMSLLMARARGMT